VPTAAAADQLVVATLYALYTDRASSDGDRRMAASALMQLYICFRGQTNAYPLHTMTLRQVSQKLAQNHWAVLKATVRQAAVEALPAEAPAAELEGLGRLLEKAPLRTLNRFVRGAVAVERLVAAARDGAAVRAAAGSAALASTARASDGVLLLLFSGRMAPKLHAFRGERLSIGGGGYTTMSLLMKGKRTRRPCAFSIILRIQDA
jgi:hypothetical protein